VLHADRLMNQMTENSKTSRQGTRELRIEETCAVLLVGGMGTRLRSVLPSTPKPLASVGNKSFLELLVRQLRHQGVGRLLMCTGYLSEQIERKFGDGRGWGVDIEYSKESHPLGTAGAIKLAGQHLREVSDFLVMNGDSFLEIDFSQLIQFHRRHCGLASIAVLDVKNASRYGTVQMDSGNRVTGFLEKTGRDRPGLVNAGVYVFSRAVLEHIPDGPASLENDTFPRLLSYGVYALKHYGMFIDIGTPEDYTLAQQLCDRLCEAALPKQQLGSGKDATLSQARANVERE
jgi:NDP-sugar pyrophosphorylase family protein